MQTILLFDLADHAESIVVGAVLLVGFGVYAYVKGWPQRTIESLKEVTDADAKALERSQRELDETRRERDGYKSDVERLLREAKIHIDIEERDSETISELKGKVDTHETTVIGLRRELADALQKLADERRGKA